MDAKLLKYTNIVIGFALLAGFLLSIGSFVELCTEECKEGRNYLIFGMHFEPFGVLFFVAAGLSFILSYHGITAALIASAVGAELVFLYIQNYVIGTWCPICLAIAACIFLAAATISLRYFLVVTRQIQQNQKGAIMKSIQSGFGFISVALLGFMLAVVGITKFDKLDAAEDRIKESLAFGDQNSEIEVYVFTDWACKSCKELEPYLERMSPALMKEAKVVYVDHALSPESLNFTPYNLSFMINNKEKYFQLRNLLTDISKRDPDPEEEQIETAAARVGVNYDQLNYSDIALGIRYFKNLASQFNVKSTPTMIIVNTDTRKGKKLSGKSEITRRNALLAIKELTD